MTWPSLPVYARATLNAAITASVPELEKRTNSADLTILLILSAISYSNSVAKAKTPPISIPDRAASSTRSSW